MIHIFPAVQAPEHEEMRIAFPCQAITARWNRCFCPVSITVALRSACLLSTEPTHYTWFWYLRLLHPYVRNSLFRSCSVFFVEHVTCLGYSATLCAFLKVGSLNFLGLSEVSNILSRFSHQKRNLFSGNTNNFVTVSTKDGQYLF